MFQNKRPKILYPAINEKNLNEYPEEEGEITGLPTIIDNEKQDKMTEN